MLCFVLLFVFIFFLLFLFNKNLHLSSNVIHCHCFSGSRSLQTHSVSHLWVIYMQKLIAGNTVQSLECLPYIHETMGSIISTTHTKY